MKILGVELKTPTSDDVRPVLIASAILLVIYALFHKIAGMNAYYLVGIVAGAAPNLYGLRLRGPGWRHKVVYMLMSSFVLGLYFLIGYAMSWLHHS